MSSLSQSLLLNSAGSKEGCNNLTSTTLNQGFGVSVHSAPARLVTLWCCALMTAPVQNIQADDYLVGSTYSARMLLEDVRDGEVASGTNEQFGAAARTVTLATGKVNELPAGNYKICYATSSSEGDDQNYFKMVNAEIEILGDTATRPSLTVPANILLGNEIPVDWAANIDLQEKLAQPNSWIGLFKAGECAAGNEWQHRCYIAAREVQAGTEAGRVTFLYEDYKAAGEFDVRFFSGDSFDGQGNTCKGLENSPHATYVQCVLEAAATSSTFSVGTKMKEIQNLDAIKGLEVVFEGSNRGRFANPW